jgi:hypothetical protein
MRRKKKVNSYWEAAEQLVKPFVVQGAKLEDIKEKYWSKNSPVYRTRIFLARLGGVDSNGKYHGPSKILVKRKSDDLDGRVFSLKKIYDRIQTDRIQGGLF